MIIKIWNWLFHACRHEWVTQESVRCYRMLWMGHRYILQCKKCGNIKLKNIN